MATWRVGRKLGRTIYLNEVCVGMVDTKLLADDIVAAMNALPSHHGLYGVRSTKPGSPWCRHHEGDRIETDRRSAQALATLFTRVNDEPYEAEPLESEWEKVRTMRDFLRASGHETKERKTNMGHCGGSNDENPYERATVSSMTSAVPWNLEQLDALTIKCGSHEKPNGQVQACAMEAAYLRWAIKQDWPKSKIVAGWTDSLDCVCPTIGAFVRRWNDNISNDETRTRIFTPDLLDLLPGTKGDDDVMLRRMWMAVDWDIRTRTPAFLRLAKLDACALALEALAPIDSQEALACARLACEEARNQVAAAWDAAWDAARDAAWDAARAAARDAAGDAAGDAARDAARAAARDAAGDAAWAAARDAARTAAGAAAGDAAWTAAWTAVRDAAGAAAPTVLAMRLSAKALLVRMCEAR